MTENVDVAIYLPSLTVGGVSRSMINIAKYLDDNYTVELVLARKEGKFLNHITDIEITVLDSRVAKSVFGLKKYLQNKKPDVLLSSPIVSNIAAIVAKMLADSDTRVIVNEPTTLSNQIREFTSLKERSIPYAAKYTYPFADHYIAVSKGVKKELIDYIGVDELEIDVVYNPFDIGKIRAEAQESVSHRWFENNVPVIVAAGRLTQQKDFPTLIRAFDKVLHQQECRLLICGEGPDRQQLEALIDHLEIENEVELTGFVDNLYKHLARGDVFVLSSAWEGFGNVLVEALACGTPVVATDCESGPSEILKDGKLGQLVPVGDYEQLAEAIDQTLENPINSQKLQDRANDFDVQKIGPEYENILFQKNV